VLEFKFSGDNMEPKEPSITVDYGLDAAFVTFNDTSILESGQIDKLKGLLIPIVEEIVHGRLVLNFCNVQSLSSAMLGLLLIIHKRMREKEGNMEIWNINQNILKVFEITQLTKIFNIQNN
jgi:anti-anti-sigma factor